MSELRTEEEHAAWSRENRFPFCDTCKKPAVWSETWGWQHSTPEHVFGLPAHLDASGHKVTARQWYAGE